MRQQGINQKVLSTRMANMVPILKEILGCRDKSKTEGARGTRVGLPVYLGYISKESQQDLLVEWRQEIRKKSQKGA